MKPMLRSLLLAGMIMPAAVHGSEIAVTLSNGGALSQISVGDQEAPEDVAWKYLGAAKGIKSRADLRNASIQKLKDSGGLPYRRVEVNGVSTTDTTSLKIPGMFDKQLKMSYENDPQPSWKIAQWGDYLIRYVHDVYSAVRDMNGEPTDHATEVLAPIAGRQVDEIIAHSWGTEAVYAAILSGYIPPPKRLILVGIPEENYAQWFFLAKYTGTEVHVVGFSTDKVQITGNIMDKFVTGLPRDALKLEALWLRRCAQKTRCVDTSKGNDIKIDYDVDAMPPGEEALWPAEPFGLHSQAYRMPGMDHDRINYYKWLAQRKLLNKSIAQLDRFDASQSRLIKDQEDRTLSEAADKARDFISQARAEGAAEEAARAQWERQAGDNALRLALISIARRACSGGIVRQEELNPLRAPPSGRRFLEGTVPYDLRGDSCAYTVYIGAALSLVGGKRLTTEMIQGSVEAAHPAVAAASESIVLPVAARLSRAEILRDLIRHVCAARGQLSQQSFNDIVDGQLRGPFDWLPDPSADMMLRNLRQEFSETLCEYDVADSILIHNQHGISLTVNNVNSVASGYFWIPPPPVDPPAPQPRPQPRPQPQPKPTRHCAAEQGNVCVWWTD